MRHGGQRRRRGHRRRDLSHVFDRFYKADPARPRSAGSGLGLAIARENARPLGGDVTVADGDGPGVTFTLVPPRRAHPPDIADEGLPGVADPLLD